VQTGKLHRIGWLLVVSACAGAAGSSGCGHRGGAAAGSGGAGTGEVSVSSAGGGGRTPSAAAGSGGAGAAGTSAGAPPAGRGAAQRDAGTMQDAMASGGSSSAADGGNETGCTAPGLVWKTAQKTNYTSYPEPGSRECIEFNGCMWQGQFAACNGTKAQDWVAAHNIVAAFPDFASLELHDLCLRSGDKTIVVTVYDTCGDADCSGCCTENKRDAAELIDIESYTDQRWGVQDGRIEWADLGPTRGAGCD
jgi:hypothetical protein